MTTSTLPQNLQEAAVKICSEKFECPSQESLPKFKEHLFLMTAFKVYHMCREHGEGSSKIFSGGFIFRWRGHPIRVASALMGGDSWSRTHPNASPH